MNNTNSSNRFWAGYICTTQVLRTGNFTDYFKISIKAQNYSEDRLTSIQFFKLLWIRIMFM
ncbi:hypothetical protein NPIRD3C_1447 [Nitrosopumilus piranensis]|uniref:Uncharacterized protein n=1 Tax=Nitrosopumilus piranensis TaxID=1582439 RepID=A0A0C5BWN1_9ARCH|nr:hypothetical protein NPIRD3C_1447 [Nitrosopumilus piranensis]